MLLCTAKKGDRYFSQLLNAGQINTSPPLQGEEDNSTAANSRSLYWSTAAANSTVLRGIPGMNRFSVGGVRPGLGPVSRTVLSAGCVRAVEDKAGQTLMACW